MRTVIKFKNESGEAEYWNEYGGYTKCLNDAHVFQFEGDARYMIYGTQSSIGCPSIWKTAKAVPVKLVEVE